MAGLISRRFFLAGLGSTGVGLGLGGFSHLFPLSSPQFGPDWSPGDENHVPSTCLLCPSHCGILGRVVDGKLVRVDGNPLHPVSQGGLCPKGRASLQLLYHPARLKGALERKGAAGSDRFEPIAWNEAIERVSGRLRSLSAEGRPEKMAWLVGDVDGSMSDLLERFASVYGSPHVVRQTYSDGSDEVMALSQGVRAFPAFDFERADLVVSFGASLSESWSCLPQVARARALSQEQRPSWIQIDTRLSRTAIAADRWIPIRPDSHALLAHAIAYVLLKEGLYDANWVREHVVGFEDSVDGEGRTVPGYRTLILRHARPEDAASRIGLQVQDIVRLAKDIGRAERPVAIWDQAVTWRRGGVADALAIHALNVLTGALERPGGICVQQPLPVPTLDELSPAPARKGTGPALNDSDWADRVLEGASSPVDVLFLYQANPIASSPDPEKVRRALERIPLVISFSPFLDETARYAHLVLPDHTFLERWGDAPAPPTLPYPVWGVVQPVVPPLHDSRATGDVVLELASRIGGGVASAFPWSSMKDLIRERGTRLSQARRGGAFVSRFRRDELREMEARGWWIAHGQNPGDFWEGLRRSGGWFDPFHEDRGRSAASRRPDGRVALFPEEGRHLFSGALPGLLEGPASGARSDQGGSRSVRLMPYRVMTLASGTTPLMPWLLENIGPLSGAAWGSWVEIHPETARELGLGSARKVRVVSDHGSFTARLCLFEGAQPGVVNAPYGLHTRVEGWGSIEPANPLRAVGAARDPVTGLPDWYSTRVRIEAV